MEHGIELRELHHPKSLRKTIGAACVGMALLGAVASAALAQGDQPSKETRELARLISKLSSQTTHALRRDGNVQKHDEMQEWAKQVLENRPLEPLNRDKFVPAIYPETPPLVPAEGPAPTEEAVAVMLQEYLTNGVSFW